MKSIKIDIPEGYEIDEEKSTFKNIVFKPVAQRLPKKWEDLESLNGYYIDDFSEIVATEGVIHQCSKNTLPTEKLAEAMLALCQLLYLRDIYNDGWVANWANGISKYCIEMYDGKLGVEIYSATQKILAFKTEELRNEFFKNFKDLVEIASPLI